MQFDQMMAAYFAHQYRHVSFVIYNSVTGVIIQEGTALESDLMLIRSLHTDPDLRIMEGACDDCDAFVVRDGEIVPIETENSSDDV